VMHFSLTSNFELLPGYKDGPANGYKFPVHGWLSGASFQSTTISTL
jgi:hypothetical protein